MPSNQFILGITHCIQRISVTSGTFTIEVDRGSVHSGWVNGFQVVPVPEPSLIVGLSMGLATLAMRRRRGA